MKKSIVIFGTSGHAKVVFDLISKEGKYTPVAFFSSNSVLKSFLNQPHYHQDTFDKYDYTAGVIAVGDNATREFLVNFVLERKPNFEFVSAVHPSAVVGSEVTIGAGSVVMPGVVLGVQSKIGRHVIVNTSASVDHDCTIGDFASLAPGCILGGNVKVGEHSAVSLGAKIIHGKAVGSHTVVGAGALVLENLPDNVVAFGSPCEVVRDRKLGDKYL